MSCRLIPLAALLTAALTLGGPLTAWAESNGATPPDAEESNKDGESTHRDRALSPRAQALVAQAEEEQWDSRRLFAALGLDEERQDCRHFGDRAYLRERHARWREAVDLLAIVDPERLQEWLLGLSEPPALAQREVQTQIRCLLTALVAAAGRDAYDVRLFPRVHRQFGGHYDSVEELAADAAERRYLRDQIQEAVTRSTFRNIHSQGFIWYRKFRFTGRAFNRISPEAAQACGIGQGIWNPDNERHRACWQDRLSGEERESEILQASAAPGLSRHHWGTDVDILGLNPALFVEGGILHGDWQWLDDHALDYGFFQTYRDDSGDRIAHMEERWHWSYYPIGQALWGYIEDNQDRFEAALFDRWDRLERRWGRGHGPYFEHMRQHWRDYLFHIAIPDVDAEPDLRQEAAQGGE